MKRILITAVLLFFSLSVLYAFDTSQKIYEIDSEEYQGICSLYAAQGYARPSTTGPWSGAELQLMLNRIDPDALDPVHQTIFDRLLKSLTRQPSMLTDEGLGMEYTPVLNYEFFIHTNTDSFTSRDDFSYGSQMQKPFFACDVQWWLTNRFTVHAVFDLKNNKDTNTALGATTAAHNVPGFQNFTFSTKDMDTNFPDVAYGAFGNEHWSVQFGKDRLSWGGGTTGNLLISDNLTYHNFARVTSFYENFKFTWLVDFFPHAKNYTGVDETTIGQNDPVDGLRFFQAHRYEVELFDRKVRAYLTEGIMYQSQDNFVDLSILNPFAVYHNYFNRAQCNSIMTLEMDYAPARNWNIYGQFVLDDLRFFTEPIENPNACGYMAGLYHENTLNHGIFYQNLEGVYTDSFTYLRDKCDFIVAIRRFGEGATAPSSVYYDRTYLGYTYGGDTITGKLTLGWKQPRVNNAGSWGVEGSFLYLCHGTFDTETKWTKVNESNYKEFSTPSTRNPDNSRTGVRTTLDTGLSAWWYPQETTRLYTQIDAVQIWNEDYAGNDAFDLQLVLGAKHSF